LSKGLFNISFLCDRLRLQGLIYSCFDSTHVLMMTLITTTADLRAACAQLEQCPFVTVDTEFLRETTFWPKLCVVQLAADGVEGVAVDALAEGLDLAPLFALLKSPSVLKVFHAARQDIEIFWHLGECIPAPLFDTQVAAMVLGYGDQIAYDNLVSRIKKVQLDKSSRFTDWSKRPLSDEQIQYALADVTHLRDVYHTLRADLAKQRREDWVMDEMAVLMEPETYRQSPEHAWKRIKYKPRHKRDWALLKTIAAWREREAQTRDVPRGRILKDDLIPEILKSNPRGPEVLGRIRGLAQGFALSNVGKSLALDLQAILAVPDSDLPDLSAPKVLPNGGHAVVELLKVLLRKVADEEGVAAKVIATTDDLEAIAIDDCADVAAMRGWRGKLFGEAAVRLKRGETALAVHKGRVAVVETALSQNLDRVRTAKKTSNGF
jgi:ribonuclease D